MYPVSYAADYAAEGRNRLTTFFRYIVAIPWQIVMGLYGFVASFAIMIAWFALLFTGRYPQGLYNFVGGYLRMAARVNGFAFLLTDEYPPFGGEEAPDYPIRLGVPPPLDRYSRAKVFFRYILGIPVMLLGVVHMLILMVCTLLSWFAIVFSGRHPQGLFGPMRSAEAYLRRATAYFSLVTEGWPPFSLEEGGPAAGQISETAATRTLR